MKAGDVRESLSGAMAVALVLRPAPDLVAVREGSGWYSTEASESERDLETVGAAALVRCVPFVVRESR